MSQKPETVFRNNHVRPFLKSLKNCVAFAIQQVSIRDDPDYLLCISGLFVALELKSSTGELRPLQAYKLDQVKTKGQGIAIMANPENWDLVKKQLKLLDEEGEQCLRKSNRLN